jgi:hypothetical protein
MEEITQELFECFSALYRIRPNGLPCYEPSIGLTKLGMMYIPRSENASALLTYQQVQEKFEEITQKLVALCAECIITMSNGKKVSECQVGWNINRYFRWTAHGRKLLLAKVATPSQCLNC